jgi:hypothetical protein
VSSATSDSDECGDDAGLTSQLSRRVAELRPDTIAAMYGGETLKTTLPDKGPQVRAAVRSGGGCRCNRKCAALFQARARLQSLIMCVALFWAVPKQGQDALLWSLAHSKKKVDEESDSFGNLEENRRCARRAWLLDGALREQMSVT